MNLVNCLQTKYIFQLDELLTSVSFSPVLVLQNFNLRHIDRIIKVLLVTLIILSEMQCFKFVIVLFVEIE